MKYVFIVNPISGNGMGKKIAKKIAEVCQEMSIDYTMHFTNYPREATEITKTYSKEHNVIFSVGGDGTLNEVVNGIVDSNNMLGIIPCGSGNDFYRTIEKKEEKNFFVDVGKVNDKYFINILSIGIDAEVANNVKIMKHKKIPKSQIYNLSIAYTFFNFKFREFKFKLHGETKKEKFTLLAVCNGTSYGNGYEIAPNAKIDDGLFDVYFVDKISKLKIPRLLNKLKKGQHEESIYVHQKQTDKIDIISDDDLVCNIDGEIIKDNIFKIKIVKKAINIYNDKVLIKKILV